MAAKKKRETTCRRCRKDKTTRQDGLCEACLGKPPKTRAARRARTAVPKKRKWKPRKKKPAHVPDPDPKPKKATKAD